MAVIFMVFVHVLMTYGSMDLQNTNYAYVIDFFGGPPAVPVFMSFIRRFIKKTDMVVGHSGIDHAYKSNTLGGHSN